MLIVYKYKKNEKIIFLLLSLLFYKLSKIYINKDFLLIIKKLLVNAIKINVTKNIVSVLQIIESVENNVVVLAVKIVLP